MSCRCSTTIYPGTAQTVAEIRKLKGLSEGQGRKPERVAPEEITAGGCHYCGNPLASCSSWEAYIDCASC